MTHRPSTPVAGVWCLPLRKRGQTDTHSRRATSAQTPTQTPQDRHHRQPRPYVTTMESAYECCVRMGHITPDDSTGPATEETNEVGPAAGPWAACLHGEMMRVYLRAVPWVWLVTAAAGLLAWDLMIDRAEDWASLPAPVSAGQEGYVPQSSPSAEVSE